MFAVIILVTVVSLLLMAGVSLLREVSMPWLRRRAGSREHGSER
jgi:thiosulfate reductase cytochrome b subunit